MKHLTIFFLLILMTVAVKAQDIGSTKRNIALVIVDKKERPIGNVIVSSLGADKAGITDRSGKFIFADMTDNDTISMILPKYGETLISVGEMDSIVVKLRSVRRFSYMNSAGQNVTMRRQHQTEPIDVLDVQAMLSRHTYRSLEDLLQGVAGLNITPVGAPNEVNVNIRGPVSINGSNEPMVVLDGTMIGTLTNANNMINIYEIKTIEVQKNATGWGALGANGVIVIKTR